MQILPTIRMSVRLALLGLTAAWSGCGRGPFIESSTLKDPALRVAGRVVSRDGSTSGLGGIGVSWADMGVSETTSPDGSFSFSQAGGPQVHLRFTDSLAPAPLTSPTGKEGSECAASNDAESADDTQNTEEIRGNEVTLGGVDANEMVTLEVDMERGVVTKLRVTRDLQTGPTENVGAIGLVALNGSQASGIAILRRTDEGLALRVEAAGLAPSTPYELVRTDANGTATTTPFTTDVCGDGQVVSAFGTGGQDPAGQALIVREVGGADILAGTVPPAGAGPVPGDDERGDGKDAGLDGE